MDLRGLRASAVQEDAEKTDGDVENLAGNFMAMYLLFVSEILLGTETAHIRMNATSDGSVSDRVDSDSCSSLSSNSYSPRLVTGGR